jgi:type II secretory pathway component PulM
LIPIAGMAMVVAIVGIVFWYKAREKELQLHQDLRLREMEHQKRMKEIELEIEKLKAAGGTPKTSG